MTPTEALQLIAVPMRPDGTWNRDREACRRIAAEALASMTTAPTAATNTGHGHVRPRPDGVKARCGGPAMCKVCQQERAAIDALPAPSGEPAEPTRADLIAALTFYANGGHFNLSDESAWDTVSGEPQNWWCDEAGTATVEDGSLAKMALAGDMTAEHFAALERGDDVCIEAGAAQAEPQAAPTPQTTRPAAHADNAPLGFTDHEKSAWSVGFEAGTTAQAAPAPQAEPAPAVPADARTYADGWRDGYARGYDCAGRIAATPQEAPACKGGPGECQHHNACMYACGIPAPTAPTGGEG